MAKQVRPWLAKPAVRLAREVRKSDGAPTSTFHQGPRQTVADEVRMYGCNLYLYAVMNWELGKPGASMYA